MEVGWGMGFLIVDTSTGVVIIRAFENEMQIKNINFKCESILQCE